VKAEITMGRAAAQAGLDAEMLMSLARSDRRSISGR
jgi:hypothetical protein